MPVSETFAGPPSLAKLSVALRDPPAAGVNCTETVHEPPGATVAPVQVSPEVVKSLASGPVFAGFQALPEPGIVELLAIGAVAGVAIALRKRRK